MLLTNTTTDTLFMNMKKELEERTGYLFLKDTDWCFSLKEGESVRTFELYVEFDHSVLFFNFSDVFWETERGKDLARLFGKEMVRILEEQEIDCFLQTEGALYLEDVIENIIPYVPEFPHAPIGKKAETLLELLEVIPLKKTYYRNNFFLKKELFEQYDLEVVPCLLDTPKLLLVEKRDRDDKSGAPSSMNLFGTISSKEEYDDLISLWGKRKEEVKEIKTVLFDYIESKGNPSQKRDTNYFIFAESSVRFELYCNKSGHFRFNMYEVGYFTFSSKEELFYVGKQILDIFDTYQKRLLSFLREIEESIDTTFYEKQAGYQFYIGDAMERVVFQPIFKFDGFTMDVTPRYQFEYKKETFAFKSVEEMFTEALSVLKKDDRKVRLPNLYNERVIDHLPKLCFELGVKEVKIPVPLYGEVKMTLKNYYQDKQRQLLDPKKEVQQIVDIVIIRKNNNSVELEKAV